MSKRRKAFINILGFIVVCCGLSGLVGCQDNQTAVEPTSVALVEEAQPTASAAPTETPRPEPTNTPEPTATNTRRPRPTATSIPTIETVNIADLIASDGETAVVTQVIDGDTIDVGINGEIYRVRYIGMDTPEQDEPFYQEASAANARLVAGQTVILVKDVSETDRYDRLLRYVFLEDGTFVNGELVRLGFARASAYPPDVAFQGTFSALQREAVSAGVGLWPSQNVAVAPTNTPVPQPLPTNSGRTTPPEQPQPTSPPAAATEAPQPTSPPAPPTEAPQPTEAPPAAPGPVVIVGVNKREEFVDIQNQGGAEVDLNGWVLVSEKGNQACPLGGVIAGGQVLRIWAMSEDAGNGGFNCGFGSNIWNNSEPDPAVLYDAAGNVVSRW